MNCLIPVCYYPLRKIFVDDDQLFLDSVMLKMHSENISCHATPVPVLNYINHDYHPVITRNNLLINNPEISGKLINKERISQETTDISVIFIDYQMPEMNGLELLKKLKHTNIKKVLMTGISDDALAIDAFNVGLIDGFIRKDDPDISAKIKKASDELEWKYFIGLSEYISDNAEFEYLKNLQFARLFLDYIRQHNIKSFYLTHANGDFLMKNDNGEDKHLLVRNRQQLQLLSKIAEEDGASGNIVEVIGKGKGIPFFNSLDYWEIPADKWDNFIYPAKSVDGDEQLVWTVIDDRTVRV